MALPILNSTPSYEVTIPSTGQLVTYRPFLVKEQKNLLIALETQDRKDLLRAITRTIKACVEVDVKTQLTTFDVDYLFTMIRSKSVGETIEIQLPCSECQADNVMKVELDSVQIANPVVDPIVQVSQSIAIKMRYPTYEEFLDNAALVGAKSQAEIIFELMLICMDSVHTDDERIDLKQESREDVVSFVESMTTSQYEMLASFINGIPFVYKDIEYKCKSCGHDNVRTLKGMDDFF